MNPEKESPTTSNFAAATSFGSAPPAAAVKNGTSSSISLSSTPTPTLTTTSMTAVSSSAAPPPTQPNPEVEMHNLNSISIIPTSSKLHLSSKVRNTSAMPIHTTTPSTTGSSSYFNPHPTASLIKIDRTTLTPIPKIPNPKNNNNPSTTIANSITITAKPPNGAAGRGRIVNSSSILSNAVAAAAASKPKFLPTKSTSIPSGTTITKINASASGEGTTKAKTNIHIKPIGGWKESTTTTPTPVLNKDVFLVQAQPQIPHIISIFDPQTNATQFNPQVHRIVNQTVIKAPPSITICEPKPAAPLQFSGAQPKAPPPHLKYLNQYMASAGKQMQSLVTTSAPKSSSSTHEPNKSIFSNSILSRSVNMVTPSVQLLPKTLSTELPKPIHVTHESAQETMINLQISNGVLSDRQGPIRMLTGESTQSNSNTIMNVVSIIPIHHHNQVQPPVTVSFAPTSIAEPKAMPTTPSSEQKRQNLLNSLQKSPRLQNRSRSLGVANSNGGQVQRRGRPRCRIPSEPVLVSSLLMSEICRAKPTLLNAEQNQLAPPPAPLATPAPMEDASSSSVIDIEISNLSKICDSLFDTLECPEQMDDKSSTKSKTVTPEKPDDENVREVTEEKFETKCNLATRTSSTFGTKRSFKDPMKAIHWKQGIGYLPSSSLYFQTNEFLLIEPALRPNILPKINPSFEQRINNVALLKATKSKNAFRSQSSTISGPTQPTNTLAAVLSAPILPAGGPAALPGNRPQQSLLRSLMSKNTQPPANQNVGVSNSKINPQMFNIPVRSIPFSWDIYLKITNSTAAPKDVFFNPFPSAPNPFEVGMKLECIDPLNSSRICVCSIVHVVGYRLKIHFDGHSPQFSFWCNADSQDIFPAGWCGKTGRKLTPPPDTPLNNVFDWRTYLTQTNSGAASRTIFTHLNSSTTGNPFRRGMKLEADDLRNSRKICVATVADVLDNRILVTFDGWDEQYDYWVEINSPFIHPVNWHQENGFNITAPPDYPGLFNWETYLSDTNSDIAPASAFSPRSPMGFKIGMKLEMVDKKNPSLIRPSTVVGIDDYEIRVLFDGWPDYYAYWMADDHPDLHPIKWCERTEHPLEPTPSVPKYSRSHACGIPACRGIGNVNNFEDSIHLHAIDCPYTADNWKKSPPLNRLLEYDQIVRNLQKKAEESNYKRPPTKSPKKQNGEFKRIRLHRPDPRPEEHLHPIEHLKVERPATPVMVMLEHEPTIKLELLSEDSCDPDPIKADELTATSPQSTPLKPDPPSAAEDETARRVAASDHILRDYVPTLYGNYHLWRQNSRHLFRYVADGEDSIRNSNPLAWTVQDVARRVSELPGCSQLATRFEENEIDGNSLLMLSQDDLVETTLRLRRGQAIKVFNYIALLREEVSVRWLIQ